MRIAMMANGVRLSGVTSREFIPGILARLTDGVDERGISVGISPVHFGLSGFRHRFRGANLSLPGHQMTVTTQHPYRLPAPRAVKRFEQADKKSLALRARRGLDFTEMSAHR
jgi:hypothetical protein